ncbi:MAG: SDR family oxidoreductase [Chlamydiales bacterium]|nr:SDR family oxidoreductase [Chlamydiales bacterium]
MGKKIVVTGGAGFLGSHLCALLIERGNCVTCIDNFSTGSKANIKRLESLEVIEHDICQPIYIECDEIYNLASPASPVHYQSDPIQTTRTSVLGALNMLELARKTGAKILQASTSEVYGDPLVHPQNESYWGHVNPIGLRSCYDEGKRCAETLFFDYHRAHSVPIRLGRIFNTYGPHMHPNDGRVVSNFIMQALQNQPITIYGDGTQTRSFCYVSDLIDGLVRLMESAHVGPMNIGNPHEFSMLDLAQEVIELTKSRSKIQFCPLPSDDPQQRKPDISKATDQLEWVPKIQLREGLQKTIAYFQETLAPA